MTIKRPKAGTVYFPLGRFLGLGVNGAGGEVSSRRRASSARFSAAASTFTSSGDAFARLFMMRVCHG